MHLFINCVHMDHMVFCSLKSFWWHTCSDGHFCPSDSTVCSPVRGDNPRALASELSEDDGQTVM